MRKDKVVSEVLGEEGVLSPSDLYSREFKRAVVGGFDRGEVTAFLERVADQLEALLNQVRDLKQDNERLREDLAQFRQMENTLQEALNSSQRLGEDVLDTARREARAMLQDARVQKMEAELVAHNKSAELTRDIQRLKEERRRLRIELLTTLESHKLLVDSLIPDDEPQLRMELINVEPEANALAAEASEAARRARALTGGGHRVVEASPAPPSVAEIGPDTTQPEASPAQPSPNGDRADAGADEELSASPGDPESV